jgi:hypothetical protein
MLAGTVRRYSHGPAQPLRNVNANRPRERLGFGDREHAVFTSFHQFSRACGVLLKLMLCGRNTTSAGVLLLVSKMKTHPHEPKDAMTVEKVSLAVLAVFGGVGLAYFLATALEVLPIIRAS